MQQAILELIFQYAYHLLLLIAIYLNYGSKDSLLLTTVVGLSALIPMQNVQNYHLWYALCIGIELGKIFLSYNLSTKIKYPVIFLCGLMVLCHIISYFITFILPYRVIIPALEHLEIVSCILFSRPILHKLKRAVKWIHCK